MNEKMDPFGKLVMEKLRDISIELCEGLLDARYDSPGHKEMQREIESFSPKQKEVFLKCITYCIDGGINDFLANLDKASRKTKDINISVKNENILHLTESLNHELYGENGWQKRFSKY